MFPQIGLHVARQVPSKHVFQRRCYATQMVGHTPTLVLWWFESRRLSQSFSYTCNYKYFYNWHVGIFLICSPNPERTKQFSPLCLIRQRIQNFCEFFVICLKVSWIQNDFMTSSFLPKCLPKIFQISAQTNKQKLYSRVPNTTVGNPLFFLGCFSLLHGLIWNFSFIIFYEKFLPTFLFKIFCVWIFYFFSPLYISYFHIK